MTSGDAPLLHFTNAADLQAILAEGRLNPGSGHFGIMPIPEALHEKHRSVCFTELPLDEAVIVARRRGMWGIALKRANLASSGANPVVYLDEAATRERKLEQESLSGRLDHPGWKISPFLSPTLPNYSFAWEKEWRHPGVYAFDWGDVEYLISPDGQKLKLVPEDKLGEVASYFDMDVFATILYWEDGDSEPFNMVMRKVVETLLDGYENPHDSLPFDREDPTGYAWMGLSQIDSYEIVEEKLPAAPIAVIDALAGNLDEQAEYWIRSSEWDDFHQ